MSARMAELQKALRNSPDVLLVSFSVDPERDTPEVFARYADNYGASKTQWLFLTGDKRDIFPLVRNGFKLVAQEAESDETEDAGGPILHSTLFVLVDARGRIRGYYDGTASETVVQLAADAQSLLRARN
jgi:protein SCO1/2